MNDRNDRCEEPGKRRKRPVREERTVSEFYRSLDNDLAGDNLENDLPEADLEDI